MDNHRYEKENRYKKVTITFAVICIIQCFVLAGLWFVIFRFQEKQSQEALVAVTPAPTTEGVQQPVSQFENPDLINQQLQQQIEQYITDQGYDPADLSIYVESEDKTVSYRLNENLPVEAASIFKLPLAMIYCDQVAEGSRTFADTLVFNTTDYHTEGENPIAYSYNFGAEIPISELINSSLIHSDNTASAILYSGLGGWESFVEMSKKYSANTPTPEQPTDNIATAAQFIDILNVLTSDQTRYAAVIDAMKAADNTLYLNEWITPGSMLQKYGQLDTFSNAVGFSTSGQSYKIVVMSRTLANPNDPGNINEIVWNVLNQVNTQTSAQNADPNAAADPNAMSDPNQLADPNQTTDPNAGI